MRVTVSRKAHFNAAHQLYNENWSKSENEAVYGKCANPEFHGHNYELIVSVQGPIDPQTGYVVDMKWLKDLIRKRVEDRFDHKNLNTQTDEFAQRIPTAENIAVVIYNLLADAFEADKDLKITLYETPRNFVEYSGERP